MKKKNIILLVFLGITIGLGSGLWYGHIELVKERAVYKKQIEDITRWKNLLHARYRQQKTYIVQLEQKNAELKSKNYQLKKKNKDIDSNLKKLQGELNDTKSKLTLLEGRITALKTINMKIVEKARRREKAYKEALKKCLGEKEKLVSDLTSTRADLEDMTRNFKLCSRKNRKLCSYLEQLLEKYENKGVINALLAKEPFTQIEKVKIENIVEEYKEKIEREKLKTK